MNGFSTGSSDLGNDTGQGFEIFAQRRFGPLIGAPTAPCGDRFSFSATGSVSYAGAADPTTPPDGSSRGGSASALGIVGDTLLSINSLIGVFLSYVQPVAPAPDQLGYGVEDLAFEILAPQLRQIFYIGDGLTGNAPGTYDLAIAPWNELGPTRTDASGNVTTLRYNDRGNVIEETSPRGSVSRFEYGDPANPDKETAIVDPNGNRTEIRYDNGGNPTLITDAGGEPTPSA